MGKYILASAIVFCLVLPAVAQTQWYADITVQWDAAQFASGYKVFYQKSGEPSSSIMIDVAGVTQTVIKDVPAGAYYIFTVRAYNDYGEGPMSDPAQADLRQPGKPGNNRIVNIDGHK